MTPARVFFPAYNKRFDLYNAEDFGEIAYVLPQGKRWPPVFKTVELLRVIKTSLDEANYDPEKDFITLTGSSIIVALTYGCIAARYGRARTLLFDSSREVYEQRMVDMDTVPVEEEQVK